MSRIGKQPIIVPDGVEVSIEDRLVKVKGPKGELSCEVLPVVSVARNDEGALEVSVAEPENKTQRGYWGLFQRLISNMITGVTEGFEKKLEVNGVGFKVALSGSTLNMALGYSHPVDFSLPEGVQAAVEKNVITITGIDKQQVGEVAAQIRKLRKPEVYKGKGIKYIDEVIRKKAGKAAKAA